MDPKLMKQHGAFSWIELLTTDVAGAKQFYGELLGWTFEDTREHGVEYTLAKPGETPMAGVMAVPPSAQGMPPAWGAYVTVDDVDRVTSRVAQLGGSVCVSPRDIPGLGRFAVIEDPQGARLSLITYTCQSPA